MSWSDIDLAKLEIRVVAATSKGRRERMVPIGDGLAGILKAWQSESGGTPNAAVLPWPYDTYRHIYHDWHVIQDAAGMPADVHYVPKNCRSSCASALIATNIPTVVVKDFLGHANVTTTENYYINTRPALRAAANARKIHAGDASGLGGDVLWAAMVYWLVRLAFPLARAPRMAAVALGFAAAIEFSQLYRAEWIADLRATRLGALAIGHGFLWSDLVCYAVGVAVAVVIDIGLVTRARAE